MTEEEKDREIGRMYREHGEQEIHLECLRSKARSMKQTIDGVSDLLAERSLHYAVERGKLLYFVPGTGGARKEISWASEEELCHLIEEIDSTKQRIDELKKQLNLNKNSN